MFIAPGQTVYADFITDGAPDALPTVKIFEATAAGAYSEITSQTGLNPTVTLVATGHYTVSITVPSDAKHGDHYTAIVSAAFDGTAETSGVALGVVDVKTAAIKAKTDLLGTGEVATVHSPVTKTGDLPELVAGDDYTATHNRELSWGFPASQYGDYTGGTAQFKATNAWGAIGPITGVIGGGNTESQSATFEPTSAETNVAGGSYEWEVQLTDQANLKATTIRGRVVVVEGAIP